MIAFFDPTRGAELEAQVVNQGVQINNLLRKIMQLEEGMVSQNSRHNRDIRDLRHNLPRQEDRPTSHNVSMWDMAAMRSNAIQGMNRGNYIETLRGIDVPSFPNYVSEYFQNRDEEFEAKWLHPGVSEGITPSIAPSVASLRLTCES